MTTQTAKTLCVFDSLRSPFGHVASLLSILRFARIASLREAFILLSLCATTTLAHSQQINIPRIDQMPNFPQPYEMRDWKKVAHDFDALVFNPHAKGQHLPLVKIVDGPNKAKAPIFALPTFVGWNQPPFSPMYSAKPEVPRPLGQGRILGSNFLPIALELLQPSSIKAILLQRSKPTPIFSQSHRSQSFHQNRISYRSYLASL